MGTALSRAGATGLRAGVRTQRLAAATRRLSIWSGGIAPGERVPSSNTIDGVPLTRWRSPSATLRSSALASHGPAALDGALPSTIQARHALARSRAHQMSRDLTFESGPRIGYKKV